ncbi:MAG: hypothetical protein NXI27_15160 [Alphaproteobacteria bacterium]|nr:hypothetical protein [Alphaproteobacteria bacterium]
MLQILRAAVVLITLGSASVAQDFDRGFAAADVGGFDTALKELRPLAENGHVTAQYIVGVLNENALGIPNDLAEAALVSPCCPAGRCDRAIEMNMPRGGERGLAEAARWYRLNAEYSTPRT